MRLRTFLLSFVVLTPAIRKGGGDPDPWASEVARVLEIARVQLGGPAARPVGGMRSWMLSEGEVWTIPVELAGGVTYTVVAACDRDCGRLALRVSDPRRYDLDMDRSATRRPVVRVAAEVTGIHKVEVTMTACRMDPCRVGLIVLVRPN